MFKLILDVVTVLILVVFLFPAGFFIWLLYKDLKVFLENFLK